MFVIAGDGLARSLGAQRADPVNANHMFKRVGLGNSNFSIF